MREAMAVTQPTAPIVQTRQKALELFAHKGFAQVGMRELAFEAGLTPGALYHHYPSKQHLLLDLIEEFYEQLMIRLKRLARRRGSQSEMIRHVVQAHVELHQELPLQFNLVQRDLPCLTPAQQDSVRALQAHYECQLLALLPCPTRLGARVRVAAGHAIVNLLNAAPAWLAKHPLSRDEHSVLLEQIVLVPIERMLAHSH